MNSIRTYSIICGLVIVALTACAPPVPDIGARPGTVSFGRVVVGMSKTSTIDLFVNPPATFRIGFARPSLSGAGRANFSISPPRLANVVLKGVAPIPVAVTCAPQETGFHKAQFSPEYISGINTKTNLPARFDCQGVGNVEDQRGAVRMSTGLSGTDPIGFIVLQAAGPSTDSSTIDVKNTNAFPIEFKAILETPVGSASEIIISKPKGKIATIAPKDSGTVRLRFQPSVAGVHGATFKISWRVKGPPAGPWNDHYFYAQGLAE